MGKRAVAIGAITGLLVAAALIGAFLLGRSTKSATSSATTTTTTDLVRNRASQQISSAVNVLVQQFGDVRSQTFQSGDAKVKAGGPPFHTFAESLYVINFPADLRLQQDAMNLANAAQAQWAADVQLDIRNEATGPFIEAERRVAHDLGIHAPCPFALPSNVLGYDPRCTP